MECYTSSKGNKEVLPEIVRNQAKSSVWPCSELVMARPKAFTAHIPSCFRKGNVLYAYSRSIRLPSFSALSGVMTVDKVVMRPLKRKSTSARLPFRITKSLFWRVSVEPAFMGR